MTVPKGLDVPFRMYRQGASPNVLEGPSDVLDRSIRTIIRTLPGERPYRPTFGSWVRALIFNNISEGAALQAGAEIRRAVGLWESRVDIDDILFELDHNSGTIFLTVVWRPNGAAQDSQTTIEFRT